MKWWTKLVDWVTGTEETVVRARNEKGHYVADDKSTPDVNEAWVGGKAPKKKAKAKKKVSKIKDNTLD